MAGGGKKITGVLDNQVVNPENIGVDTRPLPRRIKDWFSTPNNVVMGMMVLAGAAWYYAEAGAAFLILSVLLTLHALSRGETTPLKIPVQAGMPDANQPNPGTGAPMKGQGIFFLGNDLRSGKEVWLTNDDCRQHFLVLGTTGAGKTESLIGFAANALTWGSGFLFCDGKGDVALFAKVYAMARKFGREDDLLVLNFMTGNRDLSASGGDILSNTLNPFSTGSSDGLTQMIVSLMDSTGGDGAMWKGRATAMLTGVMRALCWLRDSGYLDLNVAEIRSFMSLRKIMELGDENKYPDMDGRIRGAVRSYLTSLPGFVEEKKEKQAQTTLDQHGYLEMQFTKILGSLADVYGHIFATPYGEVDMYDVVLNRRILVIMLPALEKSGDEIANLGKIVVATLKGMMGATLGSKLEGTWAEVVENRPTNSPSPFLVILDEVGYYTVEGMALMAAQARSLGFSMIYASQDIPAMKRLNEKEAASIIANTNTKIFMRTEEPNETAKLAIDRGDKAMRVRAGGYDRKVGALAGKVAVENENATYEETNRISLTDLTGQLSGEMHIVHQDKIVRARGFYANPEGSIDKSKLRLRANHFIKVPRPSQDEIEVGMRGPEILGMITRPETPEELRADALAAIAGARAAADAGDELAMAAVTFERVVKAGRKPIEASCACIADIYQTMRGSSAAFVEDVRGAYAAPVPRAAGGFDMAELDAPDDDLGTGFRDPYAREPEGEGIYRDEGGGFGDPFVHRQAASVDVFADDRGVPVSPDSPPPFNPAPRKPTSSKPRKVDPTVRHGATVDGGNMIDMADRVASNDALMRTLVALDFDGEHTSAFEVEQRIEDAVGSAEADDFRDEEMSRQVADFDRAAGVSGIGVPDGGSARGKAARQEAEDEDGGGTGDSVNDFLHELLNDREDD